MAENYKRLYRSKTNRMLLGVCGGLAEYFNTDPSVIRLLFIVLCIISMGVGILGYFIAAFIVPEQPQ